MRIESKAPTRIDLAGGTLDIWPLYLFHEGSLTVNCAITRYASCVIETAPESSRRIVLASRDIARKESFASFDALLRAALLQIAPARESRACVSAKLRIHIDDRFGGAIWRWNRRVLRHGRGHLRGT